MRRCNSNINEEMNALILDYLTVGGYSRAAASFAAEANLVPQQDNEDSPAESHPVATQSPLPKVTQGGRAPHPKI